METRLLIPFDSLNACLLRWLFRPWQRRELYWVLCWWDLIKLDGPNRTLAGKVKALSKWVTVRRRRTFDPWQHCGRSPLQTDVKHVGVCWVIRAPERKARTHEPREEATYIRTDNKRHGKRAYRLRRIKIRENSIKSNETWQAVKYWIIYIYIFKEV